MGDTFALEVVTPEQVLVAAAARSLSLSTSRGSLMVLAGFASLVGDVVPGEVKVELGDGETLRLAVHGGFLQVETGRGVVQDVPGVGDGPVPGVSTRVTVLAGVAEIATDIDTARAEQARVDALARIDAMKAAGRTESEGGHVDLGLVAAEADLARAELRLAVAGVVVS